MKITPSIHPKGCVELVVILAVLLILSTIIFVTAEHRTNLLRKEAVERGYAEWIVTPAGDASWHWKGEKHD